MTAPVLSEQVDCPCGNPVHLPRGFREPIPCIACGRKTMGTAEPGSGRVRDASGGNIAKGAMGGPASKPGRPPPRDPSAPKIEVPPSTVPAQAVQLTAQRARGFSLPGRCACCMGSQETTIAIQGERTVGNTRYTLSMSIPSCSACEGHRSTQTTRWFLAGFLAFLAFLPLTMYVPMTYFTSRNKSELDIIHIAVAAIPAIYFGLALAHIFIPVLALGREHASEGIPASITSFTEEEVSLRFDNPAYGALFAAQNGIRNAEPLDRREWGGFFFGYREDADGDGFQRRRRAVISMVVAIVMWILIASRKVI